MPAPRAPLAQASSNPILPSLPRRGTKTETPQQCHQETRPAPLGAWRSYGAGADDTATSPTGCPRFQVVCRSTPGVRWTGQSSPFFEVQL